MNKPVSEKLLYLPSHLKIIVIMSVTADFKSISKKHFEDCKKEILSKKLKSNPTDASYFISQFEIFADKIIEIANSFEAKTSNVDEKNEINKHTKILMYEFRALYVLN